MPTSPPSVPPQRRGGRRFVIPTPADLPYPGRRRRTALAEADPDDTAESATQPPDRARPAAVPDGDAKAGHSEGPVAPTPATLPRPAQRPDVPPPPPMPGTLAPLPAGDATAGEAGDPFDSNDASGRRIPNPATLLASGRGVRKARGGGLRSRRLPKVEETSAGGVVLDLTREPPAVALIARHDRRSRLLWSLPKGHLEAGETPEQAALREVREETGLLGRIVAPLGVIDFWFVVEDKRIHKTVHHFVIEAVGGELSDEDVEVEAVEWIPFPRVIRKLAYGDERRLVEKVAQIVPGVK